MSHNQSSQTTQVNAPSGVHSARYPPTAVNAATIPHPPSNASQTNSTLPRVPLGTKLKSNASLIVSVVGVVVTILGFVSFGPAFHSDTLSEKANEYSQESINIGIQGNRLNEWQALLDFKQDCEARLSQSKPASPECAQVVDLILPPPPDLFPTPRAIAERLRKRRTPPHIPGRFDRHAFETPHQDLTIDDSDGSANDELDANDPRFNRSAPALEYCTSIKQMARACDGPKTSAFVWMDWGLVALHVYNFFEWYRESPELYLEPPSLVRWIVSTVWSSWRLMYNYDFPVRIVMSFITGMGVVSAWAFATRRHKRHRWTEKDADYEHKLKLLDELRQRAAKQASTTVMKQSDESASDEREEDVLNNFTTGETAITKQGISELPEEVLLRPDSPILPFEGRAHEMEAHSMSDSFDEIDGIPTTRDTVYNLPYIWEEFDENARQTRRVSRDEHLFESTQQIEISPALGHKSEPGKNWAKELEQLTSEVSPSGNQRASPDNRPQTWEGWTVRSSESTQSHRIKPLPDRRSNPETVVHMRMRRPLDSKSKKKPDQVVL